MSRPPSSLPKLHLHSEQRFPEGKEPAMVDALPESGHRQKPWPQFNRFCGYSPSLSLRDGDQQKDT